MLGLAADTHGYPGGAGLLSPRRTAVWGKAARHACFGLVPIGFTLYIGWFAIVHRSFAVDFHYAFWPAGQKVLNGLSPYVGTTSPLVRDGVAFVYPAPGALLFAALAWLPHGLADVLFTLGCIAAALGTLRVLGVRDWRLYGLLLLWPPVLSGWQTANLSLLLAIGIAAAWRLRDRPLFSGLIVGLLVSLKVFVWPLGLWLLATRRYRALGWACVSWLAANLLAWAILGFDQLHRYSALASSVTKVEERMAYTPLALLLHLGAGLGLAELLSLLVAGAVAVYCMVYGRRGREQSCLLLAIALALLATPIVWRHYFVLLIVPLAIARPRLSAIWLLPLLMFPCPVTAPSMWERMLVLGVFAVTVGTLLRWPEPILVSTERRGRPRRPGLRRLVPWSASRQA